VLLDYVGFTTFVLSMYSTFYILHLCWLLLDYTGASNVAVALGQCFSLSG